MALPEQTPKKRQYDGQIKAQVPRAVSYHIVLHDTIFHSEAILHCEIKGSVCMSYANDCVTGCC
jgi:hypothetical protein